MKYFEHYTNDRNSIASKLIRRKFGAKGYGIYISLLECIGEYVKADNFSEWGQVDAMHDMESLADECSTSVEELKEFLLFCDEKKIFEKKNGRLYSSLILERLDAYARKVGQSRTKSDNVAINENRIDENRREEKRIDSGKSASPKIEKPTEILGVKTDTILEKKSHSGISTAWQDKAFRLASYLNLSLKNEKLKERWLAFIKGHDSPHLDETTSYLVDYPPYKALANDEARMKYFISVFYSRT